MNGYKARCGGRRAWPVPADKHPRRGGRAAPPGVFCVKTFCPVVWAYKIKDEARKIQ